jgi:hypothetical protein
MVRAFVGFTLAVLPLLLFVAYCRSLLHQASNAELSTAALNAIAAESARISGEDFHRLRALVVLCPPGRKDEFPLAAVSIYFFLLTVIYGISSRIQWGQGQLDESRTPTVLALRCREPRQTDCQRTPTLGRADGPP